MHLSENPLDNTKLLISYEIGSIVVWDLSKKAAEVRFAWDAPLRSSCWFSDGKQFMCSHVDGSLTTWSLRQPQRPVSLVFPHAKQAGQDGRQEPCSPILKVEWKSSRGL
jgi:syntaxin-binding protein 5